MSKKYMDFAPKKTASRKAATGGAVRTATGGVDRVATGGTARVATGGTARAVTTRPRVVMPEPTAIPRTRMVRREISRQVVTEKTVGSPESFMIREGVQLGEIEDLSPKFVKTDVPKRALGGNPSDLKKSKATVDAKLAEAKSKKLRGMFRSRSAAGKASESIGKESMAKKATEKSTFTMPKSPFINQDKVMKRPLSKNVYQKTVKPTEEKANKGPVTIISKPEKESRAGLVVAIILTIILGAVAGTLAFLLLPK